MSAIIAEGRSLVKKYDTLCAVNGIHFQIHAGECYGFYGNSGSGKSTLLNMIAGSCLPTAGELFINGQSVKTELREIKRHVSYVSDKNEFDGEFSLLENCLLFGMYHGVPQREAKSRVRDWFRELDLEQLKDENPFSLSPFVLRKASIARAMINEPQILILDEPSNELTADESFHLSSIILEIKKRGVAIVIASRYATEIETLCDRFALVNKGRSLVDGAPTELVRKNIGIEIVEFIARREDLDYFLSRFQGKYEHIQVGNRIFVFIKEGQDGKQVLNQLSGDYLLVRKSSVRDLHLKLVGGDVR